MEQIAHQRPPDLEEMSILDAWNDLCISASELVHGVEGDDYINEQAQKRTLRGVISPGLHAEGLHLLRKWLKQKNFVIDDPEVESLIRRFVAEVDAAGEGKSKEGKEERLGELEAQAWIYFDFLRELINTRLLEREVSRFYSQIPQDGSEPNKKELLDLLCAKENAPSREELSLEINLIRNRSDNGSQLPLTEFVDMYLRLREVYALSEHDKTVAKISMGYLAAQGLLSVSPAIAAEGMFMDKGAALALASYYGAGIASEKIQTETNVVLAQVMLEVASKINERITNSLFYREFEFNQEVSQAEIYAIIKRGKSASLHFIEESIQKLAPVTTGIVMSIGFLSAVNLPMGIGVGISMPFLLRRAIAHSAKQRRAAQKQSSTFSQSEVALQSARDSVPIARVSAHSSVMAGKFKDALDAADEADTRAHTQSETQGMARRIEGRIIVGLSLIGASVLEQFGYMTNSSVMAGVLYSERIIQPLREIADAYVRSARYIYDIKKMDQLLGNESLIDRPDGEREANRQPVSVLARHSLSVRGLSVVRGRNEILKDVSFDVPEGSLCALVGESGAGKSTLLKIMAGIDLPQSGRVLLGGGDGENGVDLNDIKRYGPESRYTIMSYTPQLPPIFEHESLRENVLLWSVNPSDDDTIFAALRTVGLDKFANPISLEQNPHGLSGGERVRIGIARMLLKNDATLFLIDEPTAGLDGPNAQLVREAILKLHETTRNGRPVTVVCATHDMELVNMVERSNKGKKISIQDVQRKDGLGMSQ